MANQFYFAWVLSTDNVFGVSHHVKDEQIVSFTVEHTEGDFAGLTIDVKNPRIGLLAPTRKTWAWLAWNNGVTTVPLFFGRLVGIPNDIHREIIRLQFTARPTNYAATKVTLANTLKVAPYYDPIWIAETSRDDPDTVLEARSSLWHIDRVTHVVSVSDVLVGEDGNQDFLTNEVPYDSVGVRLNQPPLRSVTVDGQVQWSQAAKGSLVFGSGTVYYTYTGDGFISGWPKPGGSVGGGWNVAVASAIDADRVGDIPDNKFTPANQTDTFDPTAIEAYLKGAGIYVKLWDYTQYTWRFNAGVFVPLWRVRTNLTFGYDVSRQRTEHVRFTLKANVQPIVTLPGEDEALKLDISSVDVGEPLPSTEVPIVDVLRRSYFPTTRGLQSLEYLIALARSNLLIRSRAVEVEFQCRFERAVTLSCRKNARLFDHRLPGGEALGKIIKYSFGVNGNTGIVIGSVTIGCAIGYGGAISPVVGTPNYVNTGYVNVGYQTYSDQIVVLAGGDVGYTIPIDAPNDDGIEFQGGVIKGDVVTYYQVHNPYTTQGPGIVAHIGGATTADAREAAQNYLKTIPTQVEIHLKPLDGGPFETAYDIDLSDLEIPKMIDLEAPA